MIASALGEARHGSCFSSRTFSGKLSATMRMRALIALATRPSGPRVEATPLSSAIISAPDLPFRSTPGGDPDANAWFRLMPWFRSTPPRGGRLSQTWGRSFKRLGFDPRPRAGGDAPLPCSFAHGLRVSIHAPARGATGAPGNPPCRHREFRSTPPRGGRQWSPRGSIDVMSFRSTPPRGGRRARSQPCRCCRCFDPRPRAGGDSKSSTSGRVYGRFRSTPPRGGRHQDRIARVNT